jgi:hypothetical protein
MITEPISSAFYASTAFNEINDDIKQWDYDDLTGEGFVNIFHSPKYAYLSVNILKNELLTSTQIQWEDDLQVPLEFRESIKDVFSFFIAYTEGLKGQVIPPLRIRIIDGDFHPVDSSNLSFRIATIYAIRDCFKKPVKVITENDRGRISEFKSSFEKYN